LSFDPAKKEFQLAIKCRITVHKFIISIIMQTQKTKLSLNGKMLSLHQLIGQSARDALVKMNRLSGNGREYTIPTKASPSDIKSLT